MSSFTINPFPQKNDIQKILQTVWGNSPVLTYVGDLISLDEFQKRIETKDFQSLENKSIALYIEEEKKPVGCVVLKINPGSEVELGSLAILPPYRNKGLSNKLITFLEPICKMLISEGYSLTTFATIGSPVLYSIVKVMEKLSGIKPLVLQFTPGVVPVEKKSVSPYLSAELRSDDGEVTYTSTIQLVSTHNINADTEALTSTQNNAVFLLPIKLTLVIINTTSLNEALKTIDEAQKKNTSNTIQYRVPASDNFKEVLNHFCQEHFKYVGYALENGFRYYVFIEKPAQCFESVKVYLENFPVPEIQEAMKRLHTSPCN